MVVETQFNTTFPKHCNIYHLGMRWKTLNPERMKASLLWVALGSGANPDEQYMGRKAVRVGRGSVLLATWFGKQF